MTDNSIYTQAEQIEALALVLQESMEHGGNLAPETYATVAARQHKGRGNASFFRAVRHGRRHGYIRIFANIS